MFLRKDIVKVKTGNIVVPFCKDCNSQEIETIQICKKCGSHNITADWMDDRSIKQEYAEKEVHIYKCDCCGKEFDGFKTDKFISYSEGEFICGKYDYNEDYDYEYPENWNLEDDLCNNCKQKLVDELNYEVSKIINIKHIDETYKRILKGDDYIERK